MRTVTVTEKYRAVQEGRMAKSVFLQHMKREYPFYISQFDNFDSSVSILKNKGMLFEEKKDDVYNKDYYKFSDEGVRRGTDAELTKMGIDSTRPGNISKEDLEKAKETALKNLRKDPLYYLNLLSGDSLHVDKHDKPVEYKKGNEKDVFNGMKKAELKENKKNLKEVTGDAGLYPMYEAFQKAGIGMNENIFVVEHGPFGRHSTHDKDHPSGISSEYGPAKKFADDLEEERLDAIEKAKEYYADKPGSFEKLAKESDLVPEYIFGKQPEGSDLFSTYTVPKGYEVVFEFYRGMEDTFVETAILKQLPGEPENEKPIDIDLIVNSEAEVSEADAIPTEPGIPGQRASNHNRKMALRKVIDTLTKDGHPEKGYKVSNDEALSFIRTYKDEIFNGTIDFNNAEAVWDEYEESESVDRDSVDEQEVEEQMTDQQMKDIQNYGKADSIVKPFKPGDMWSNDFDYEGMLEAGLKVRLNTPLETMQALYSSFEDVNYHSENKHLGAAIDAKEEGDKSEALDHLRNFRKAVKETLLNLNEGGNPLRDVEEVMGYNRRGEKEEEPRPSNYTKVSEKKGLKEYSDDDDEQEWRDEFPEAIKYSWEWDDEGVESVNGHIDNLFSRGAPNISKEEAMEMMGRPDDETAKAFNQAFITQMQETDDTGGDEMDYQYTINLLYAYEKTYGEPFNTNLIKFLSPYKDAKPKTYDEYKKYVSNLLGKEVSEKKGKDHDGDGDVDGDDYMAAKDKAIKKAMGKEVNEDVVRKNIKSIITKVLEEQTINEAATNQLSKLADDYGDFKGMQIIINDLENIVTDVESYYAKTKDRLQDVMDKVGDVSNPEGLKVGAFIAPAIEAAFRKDLRPVISKGFTKDLSIPKVQRITQTDINRGYVGEAEPKQTVFSPVNEKRNINEK